MRPAYHTLGYTRHSPTLTLYIPISHTQDPRLSFIQSKQIYFTIVLISSHRLHRKALNSNTMINHKEWIIEM